MGVTCREGCGACCDPVTMRVAPDEVEEWIHEKTKRWMLDVLVEMPRAEAFALAPWLDNRQAYDHYRTDGQYVPAVIFYRCTWFDRDTRRCLHYEDRCVVCSEYPHYGQPVTDPHAILPPTCSFRVEIGREVEPLPDSWQPVALLATRP